jgi:hypothetical protein
MAHQELLEQMEQQWLVPWRLHPVKRFLLM